MDNVKDEPDFDQIPLGQPRIIGGVKVDKTTT